MSTSALRIVVFVVACFCLSDRTTAQSAPDSAPALTSYQPPVEPLPAMAPQLPAPDDVPARLADLNEPGSTQRMGPLGLLAPMVPCAEYRVLWLPSAPVTGQNTNLSVVREDLSFSCPLWVAGGDALSLNTSVRSEILNTGALLPHPPMSFPADLWNIRFGASYRHTFDNGWIAGGSVNFGSDSDKPFHSINEINAGVNAFFLLPHGERDYWFFTLSYSPTGELNFPVPGVAYLWNPTDNFRALIGLPFSIMYRPIDDLTIDMSYMLLTTVRGRVTYRVAKPLKIYVAFDMESEAYALADREDNNSRFYSYDSRVSGGVQWQPTRNISIDLSGGYVFDRYYYEGSSFSDRQTDRVDVGSGPFVGLRATYRW